MWQRRRENSDYGLRPSLVYLVLQNRQERPLLLELLAFQFWINFWRDSWDSMLSLNTTSRCDSLLFLRTWKEDRFPATETSDTSFYIQWISKIGLILQYTILSLNAIRVKKASFKYPPKFKKLEVHWNNNHCMYNLSD